MSLIPRQLVSNLPSERLVLLFGVGIALAAYLYWTAVGLRQGEGWTDVPALRALFVLGSVGLLAGLLRVIRAIDES
ncbi:MAG: hypothetical protein Rubg2KO_03900 [Rubricoccaceae bacterium]